MADSAVAVTAGTGTSIDTRTEATNGHHRQVVVLGDPATNAGVAPVDATAGLKVDLGADNDITGTVTANLSATDNAVLDAIAASVDTIDSVDFATQTTLAAVKAKTDNIPALGQALAAASVPVVLPAAQITTLTPPAAITGFATSAKQDTIIGHIDGVETLLGTIDTDTGNIATEVAGLLTDTELRATPVPVSGSLTVDLGANNDVTVTSGAITETNSGAIKTSVELIDDAIYTDGAGTPSKAIAVAGTDGTNPQIIKTDANGELQVDVLSMPSTTITATDLDIRNLVNTDVVTAELSATDNAVLDTIAAKDFATQTTLAAINAKMVTGTDIGDVTINNSTGAAAVNIQDGGNTITVDGTVGVSGTVAVTQSGTWDEVGINDSGNSITVDYATTGSGTATGALRVELPTNGTGVIATVGAVTAITNALPAGTNTIGKLAANSGVDIGDVDVTSISAGTNLIGDVSLQPRTGNGCTIFRSIDLDESEEEIKATAGNVYGYYFYNAAASVQYLKFYNATAANVTVGTTTPVLTLPLPAGAAANVGFPYPVGFATAITAAATTGIADNDTGAPATNSVVVNVFYK